MPALTEGTPLLYVLTAADVENLNSYTANHPDRQPLGVPAPAALGQRVPATVVQSLGPGRAGPWRLAVRLDGANPPEAAYYVGIDDLVYADGAWHKAEPAAQV